MPRLSIPSYSTAFAVVPTEERSTKTNCRRGARGDRGEESDVRYIRIARAGRLGFCRGNPVELRKGGDFFSCARSTIRVLVHYSRTVAFSPFLPPRVPLVPTCRSSCSSSLCPSDRAVNFFRDGSSRKTPRNHDTFVREKSREKGLTADPRHLPLVTPTPLPTPNPRKLTRIKEKEEERRVIKF